MSNHISKRFSFQSTINPNNGERISSSRYEFTVVHPAAAVWLTEHGYTFRHEVSIADYGRADYVATHEDGHVLIVECKSRCTNFSSIVRQVKGYQGHYNVSSLVAIAAPREAITDHIRQVCVRQTINLIELNVPLPRSEPYVNRGLDAVVQRLLMNREKWGELAHDLSFLILQLDTPSAHEYFERVLEYLSHHSDPVQTDPEALVEKAIEMYRSQGKSDRWICMRFRAVEQHISFIDVFQQALRVKPSSFQYSKITDVLRLAMWKRDTQQLRDEMGLDSKANLRDYETELGIAYETVAELISEYDLNQETDLEYEQAKQIVRSDSEFVGIQANAAGQRIGIDLPTGRPLLAAKTKNEPNLPFAQ